MTASFRITIPARYGSSRLPGKPLVPICGRPLLEHVWRCAESAGADAVVIATDDERIGAAALGWGADVCYTHGDHASGTDRLAEVARQRGWGDDDIIVNLQGDEPLTPPAVLRQVAEDLAAANGAAMATLATPCAEWSEVDDPNVVKVVTDVAGNALYFSRAPVPYDRNGAAQPGDYWRHVGIYAYRCAFLQQFTELSPVAAEQQEALEQLRALGYGHRIHVGRARALPGSGVDTAEDVERVAAELESRCRDQ